MTKIKFPIELRIERRFRYDIPGHVETVEQFYAEVPVTDPRHHHIEYWDEKLVSETRWIEPLRE